MIPLLDYYLPLDIENPRKQDLKKLKYSPWFKLPIYLSIINDWFCLIWGINFLQTHDLNILQKIGIIFAIANFEGSSINLSHEINHKSSSFEKILGTINLSKSLYMHFLIEHNYGHHINVATDRDPASSKFNQDLYSFLPQTVYGGFIIHGESKIKDANRLTIIKLL